MPSDVKAALSLITLLVAIGFAYWERNAGNPRNRGAMSRFSSGY